MSCDIFLVFMTVNLPLESSIFTLIDVLSGGEDVSKIPRRDLLLKNDHGVGRGGGRVGLTCRQQNKRDILQVWLMRRDARHSPACPQAGHASSVSAPRENVPKSLVV